MTSTGAGRPSQALRDRAPWRTRTSRPSTTTHPRSRAAARSAVSPSRGTRSTTTAPSRRSSAASGQVLERGGVPVQADRGAVDQHVGGVRAPDGADAEVGGQRPGPLRGAVPDRDVGRAGRAQGPGDGPGAAAGAEDQGGPPARRGSGRRARRAPRGRRCCRRGPRPWPGSKVRVFAAPTARAVSVAVSASASAASLCGIVTFAPAKPACGRARTVSANSLRRDGEQLVAPRPASPRWASAALCIAGERLCATGQPRTPRRRRLSSATGPCRRGRRASRRRRRRRGRTAPSWR